MLISGRTGEVYGDRGKGGVLFLGDAYTKTGRPVIEGLIEKLPTMRIPDLANLECSSFEEYEKNQTWFPWKVLKRIYSGPQHG